MPNQISFGTILREAREQRNLELIAVARRLRIRPDILETIEDSDFSRMPPRGFTRNMVNAYAHFLGLNATDVTRMYLDEFYAYQVGTARARGARSHGFDMGAASNDELRKGEGGRRRFSDSTTRMEQTSRMQRLYSENNTHKTKRGTFADKQYTNFVSGVQAPRLGNKKPLVIAAGIAVLLLIFILVLIYLNRPQEAPTEVIPVSGASQQVESSEQQVQAPPSAPTEAKVSVEIASGKSAYLEIYQDGSNKAVVADEIAGPKTYNYDVTNQLRIVTTSPKFVKVTVDGKEVKLEDSRGKGVYSITVKFEEILAAWNKEHSNQAGSSEARAGASATPSASSESNSSSGSSSSNKQSANSGASNN